MRKPETGAGSKKSTGSCCYHCMNEAIATVIQVKLAATTALFKANSRLADCCTCCRDEISCRIWSLIQDTNETLNSIEMAEEFMMSSGVRRRD